jgi:hypothetical protein
MLVSFLGSPCSGKTTTAAMLEAKLKEDGLPAERLAEYARVHIARKRVKSLRENKEFSPLTDEDQWSIFKAQAEMEDLFEESLSGVTNGMVISDTSCLNALLYMSRPRDDRGRPTGLPFLWDDVTVKNAVKAHLQKTQFLFFYSRPVDMPVYAGGDDPNRVHTHAQSKEVDEIVLDLIGHFNLDSHIPLVGTTGTRFSRALSSVNSRLHAIAEAAEKKAAAA